MYEDSTVFIGVDSSVSVLTDPIFITVHMILFNVFYQVMIKSNKARYTATLTIAQKKTEQLVLMIFC